VDLRRRSKNRVMKAIAGEPDMAMGKGPARANGDCGVDRVNSVAESRDEAIEPISQRSRCPRRSKQSLNSACLASSVR
jgi:hypothetical protein